MKDEKTVVATGFLSRSAILAIDDLKIEKLDVPEWGGHVFIRTMTGTERDQFEKSMVSLPDAGKEGEPVRNLENFRAKLCALTIVNEVGKPLFTINEANLIGKKSSAAISRIFDAAAALNGIGQKDVNELAKNSSTGQNEG